MKSFSDRLNRSIGAQPAPVKTLAISLKLACHSNLIQAAARTSQFSPAMQGRRGAKIAHAMQGHSSLVEDTTTQNHVAGVKVFACLEANRNGSVNQVEGTMSRGAAFLRSILLTNAQ